MRVAQVLAAVLAATFMVVTVPLAVAQPADPPGLACITWQNQWRAQGASMTLPQVQAFLNRVPAICVGTRAQAQTRIDVITTAAQSHPPRTPPDPCANANAAWPYLRRSNDPEELEGFIRETPAQCSLRREAQARLQEITQHPASPPPTTATPRTTAPPAPGVEVFRDCPDVCPEMVRIRAGSFVMGSPANEASRHTDEPQRTVNLPVFAAGRYDVTRSEWAAFVAETNRADGDGCYVFDGRRHIQSSGSWRNPGFPQTDRDPVVCVSWDDAQDYVRWLSRRTGQHYRLLSEAEWEYAARGGTTSTYYWGGEASHDSANFGTESCCAGLALGRDQWSNTSPVGAFPPNAFGLYDMAGNVWQWVQDCYTAPVANAPRDGAANDSASCASRAMRGGSWDGNPQALRSAVRYGSVPSSRFVSQGFRVAEDLN